MSTIIIAEKPSQARDIKAALGSSAGTVLAAEGHLLTLEEPEDVNPAWKAWSTALLRPEGLFRFKPAKGGNKAEKLKAIKQALGGATRVIIATDCDREGQLIGQEILEYLKFKGKVDRAIFTAQDPATLKTAFAAVRPNSEYQNMYQAAVARQQADQIYNLSLTRTATVSLKSGAGGGVIGVGRVKTPTLAIVVRRELEILNFKPVTYYEVHVLAVTEAGDFTMKHAPAERILDKAVAEHIQKVADGHKGPLAVKVEDKKRSPPKLFDLPALQKTCASRFGWTATKTLEVAQELYDGEGKKLITYPRAESRYLSEAHIGDVNKVRAGLGKIPKYSPFTSPEAVIRKGKSGVFSDKALAGVSHHAIIPNVNTVEKAGDILPRCSDDERKMFDIIARSYLAAMMDDYLYRQTVATIIVPDGVKKIDFVARGQIPVSMGWRAVYADEEKAAEKTAEKGEKSKEGEEEEQDERSLPNVKNGDDATLKDPKVAELETRPPPRYNEGGLIEAMQNAWKFVDDKALADRLKEAKGIGTPATRANVIDGLKRQGFLEARGKHIVPTQNGMSLYDVFSKAAPDLVNPATTAMWEFRLDSILQGEAPFKTVIGEIAEGCKTLIDQIVSYASSGGARITTAGGGKAGKPTSRMVDFAKNLATQKGIKLPKGATTDSGICKAFLDEHAGAKGAVGGGPSEKSREFAEKIAASASIQIPEAALKDQKSLSAWIDANKDAGKSKTPTTAPGRDGRFDKKPAGKKCPKCGKADLSVMTVKDGPGDPFYSCDDQACGFYLTIGLRKRGKACPKCGGFVFERKTKSGESFWRCVQSPQCEYRESA